MTTIRNKRNRLNRSLIGVFLVVQLLCLCEMIGAADAHGRMPGKAAVNQLANETMLDFAITVKAKDFTVFYTKISKFWQEQITKEQLAHNFRSFTDQDIDLTILAGHDPAFKQTPHIDSNGWLVLEGGYEVYPFIVDFILKYLFENKAWKLVGMDVETSPMEESRPKPGAMPSTVELNKMVGKTMLDFARAVNARDFSGFYARISESWQKQVTAEQLAATFKAFSDNKIDLTVLEGHDPVLTKKPLIDNKGALILKGEYEVYPIGVPFDLTYIYEAPSWKLLGIHVETVPKAMPKKGDGGLPSEPELKRLVHHIMLEFAQAVKAKDFTDFYDNVVAKVWQNQTPKDKFGGIFKAFTDKNIDLTVIQGLDPVFEKKPRLGDNGWLHLNGTYPTKPSTTYFKLKFFPESSGWKLVGIKIQIK